MAEHEITVTIRTDEEYTALQELARRQWRDETQQLNTEVERVLLQLVKSANAATQPERQIIRRGPRAATQAA